MGRKNKIREPFDKLKGLMKEKRYSQEMLARELNISTVSLNRRLNGTAAFQWTEMKKILEVLDIPDNEIGSYFFASTLRKRNKIV